MSIVKKNESQDQDSKESTDNQLLFGNIKFGEKVQKKSVDTASLLKIVNFHLDSKRDSHNSSLG